MTVRSGGSVRKGNTWLVTRPSSDVSGAPPDGGRPVVGRADRIEADATTQCPIGDLGPVAW